MKKKWRVYHLATNLALKARKAGQLYLAVIDMNHQLIKDVKSALKNIDKAIYNLSHISTSFKKSSVNINKVDK